MPVLWKAALCALSVPLLALAEPAGFPIQPPTIGDNTPLIARVECSGGSGTAFRTGRHTWLSVSHVTKIGECSIAGEPLQNVWFDPDRDFSIFWLADREGRGMGVDCNGFVRGKRYQARGHARGLPQQTTVTLESLGLVSIDGRALLQGVFAVIPGQSGGPIIDPDTGKAVGMINAYDSVRGVAYSVSLSDTEVCRHA